MKRDAEKVYYNLFYVPSLLTKYKHGGPFISLHSSCLKGIKDEIEKKRILPVKILYCLHTSGNDAQQRPHLYEANQLSLAEMKINIVMLLTNSADVLPNTPPNSCEDEVLKILSLYQQMTAQNAYKTSETSECESKTNEPCVVIWY